MRDYFLIYECTESTDGDAGCSQFISEKAEFIWA
ncbi:MAG: hypothetical protein K0R48_363 [Gammaproteobacteria bacterium]|jgi:hypothetical protein|nr:hypothetical protein [Gammaproteobacteria bacterium]